jgi:hypothetical protein
MVSYINQKKTFIAVFFQPIILETLEIILVTGMLDSTNMYRRLPLGDQVWTTKVEHMKQSLE